MNTHKNPNLFKIGLVILAGILVIIIIVLIDKNNRESGVSSSQFNKPEVQSQKFKDNQSLKEVKPEELPANIGIIKKTGCIVRVEQFDDNADVNNRFTHPAEGNRFLAFLIIMDNTDGKEKMSLVGSGSFKLKDKQGIVYQAEAIIGKEPMFNPMADLGVGEKAKGWVTFDVPKEIKYNECKIKYEFLSEESTWITLK